MKKGDLTNTGVLSPGLFLCVTYVQQVSQDLRRARAKRMLEFDIL